MSLLVCVIFLFLCSCESEKIEPTNSDTPDIENPNQEELPPVENGNTDPQDTDVNIIEIGKGSGYLEIKDVEGKEYTIKPGSYTGIRFENVKNTIISGQGKVTISGGEMNFYNVNQITVSNISIENYSQAAINIFDDANNLTLKDLKIKNISNTVITFRKNERYDGSTKSFSENIHLINILAENIQTLFGSQGQIEKDGFYGLIKGFKLTGSKIINSPNLGNAIYLGCGEDYEISNNIIDNVNKSDHYPNGNNNHNGIFHLNGNGKVFGNKVTNDQGNVVRAWLFSITKPGSVEIYKNIAYNTTKYGAFEIQVRDDIKSLPTFKPANAKIYNNTVGKLNTGKDFFGGRLLDLYQTYGQVEIYNNLSFDLRDDVLRDDMLVNNMSDPKVTVITRNTDNYYFKSANEAVMDLINFKSKISNVGAF